MSYVNQDPDIIVPHKGKQVVAVSRAAWIVDMERRADHRNECDDGLSFAASNAACWCGACPGSCNDCKESDDLNPYVAMGKINISSGEDASWSYV